MAAGGFEGIGFVAFAGVKALGYTLAARQFVAMSGLKATVAPKAIVVGLARTLVGVAIGVTYGYAWFHWGGGTEDFSPALYYALLFPVRLIEWSAVMWMFFGADVPQEFHAKTTLLGTVYSYALDFVGVITALIVPGGIWVC